MIKNEKLSGALGLCRRAGKVTSGTFLVSEEIRKSRAALVLIASDAGKDAERKMISLAQPRLIPVQRVSLTKSELALALGKEGEVNVVSVPKEFLNLVLASL